MFEKSSSTERSDYWLDGTALICFVAGVFFVIAIARTNLGVYNSDEAIAGLMARDALDRKFEAFFWSQDYGGTVAVFLLALVTFVFGADLAMRLTPLIELMLIALLSFHLFRRVVPASLARLGGGLTMCASAAWIWSVSRPMLFYNATLIAGLLLLILSTNTTSKLRIRETAWLSLVAGIGWWTSPQFLIFLGASAVFIDRRLLATTKKVVVLLLSFILGSLPWWWSNIETGFDSVIKRPPGQGTLLNHLHTQFVAGFPVISGLREPFTLKWIPPSFISLSLVGVLGISYFRRSKGGPRLRYLPLVGLSFFVAFTAAIPTGWFVGGGRYYVFAFPFLIMGLLLLIDNARQHRLGRLISVCFVFLVIFNTARSLSAVRNHQFGPTNLDEVSESLKKSSVQHVYGDYWSTYVMAFENQGLKVAPFSTDRNSHWSQSVRNSSRVAYVFWLPHTAETQKLAVIEPALESVTKVERSVVGDYVILIPESNVPPEDLDLTGSP